VTTVTGVDAEDGRTDEQLLARYADASLPRTAREDAFRLLVRRFQRRVFAVCLRTLGGDVGPAEEATQEVFVRLARSADTFRGDAKLSTWLYAVARNVATDRVRYEARRPATAVADVAELTGPGGGSVPDGAIAEDRHGEVEARHDLAAALATLDPVSRTLLLLIAVEGLSYAEAAAAVDCAVGTAKSRVSRARVRLGELLADGGIDQSARSPAPDRSQLGPRRADPGAQAAPRGPPATSRPPTTSHQQPPIDPDP
jgi:RNA polymerase sigma-70 factor, ECF subfamily